MDFKKHLVKLQGRDYLPVAARIVAFREQHPAGVISTELVDTDPVVIVRANIHADGGVLLGTGYGTAPLAGKGSYAGRGVEKAETAAIGRALAHAGFGTLYATDANDDDGDNLADSPIDPRDKAMTDAIMDANAKANERHAAANGWTRAQADSLITEAHNKGVTTEEVLGVLGVKRISEYPGGFGAAREMLAAYAKDKPKAAAGNGALL